MKKNAHRKTLQVVTGILAIAPLSAGLIGLSGIYNPLFLERLPENPVLDSNLRFLNAMSVAVALSFYFIIPVIEKETLACRIVCCSIFSGGVGRLISFCYLDAGFFPLFLILMLEMVCPIIIMYWQQRIASETTD